MMPPPQLTVIWSMGAAHEKGKVGCGKKSSVVDFQDQGNVIKRGTGCTNEVGDGVKDWVKVQGDLKMGTLMKRHSFHLSGMLGVGDHLVPQMVETGCESDVQLLPELLQGNSDYYTSSALLFPAAHYRPRCRSALSLHSQRLTSSGHLLTLLVVGLVSLGRSGLVPCQHLK